MKWFDLLLDFEGVIGALLGVGLTLIITHFLQGTGKVYNEVANFGITFYDRDEWGAVTQLPREIAESMKIEFTIDFYNNSEVPKPIKGIHLELLNKSGMMVGKVLLNDKSTEHFAAASYHYEEFSLLNLMPKHLEEKDLFFSASLINNPEYREIEGIRLIYRNPKGRIKKIKIR